MMRLAALIAVLLLSSVASADELVAFNGQEFTLKTGNCMSVYRGEKYYCWAIVKFESIAELRISQLLAEKLALQSCEQRTTDCEVFITVCAK